MRVGITGHQDIPGEAIAGLHSDVMHLLGGFPEVVGITSLAQGADQLFAQCIVETGNTLHVVVPCRGYEATLTGSALNCYVELLSKARNIEVLDFPSPSQQAFYAAGQRVVELSDRLVAIWDGGPSHGFGGTADVVEYARAQGIPVTVLWPAGLART